MRTKIWGSYFRIGKADILVQNQRNKEAISLLDRVAATRMRRASTMLKGCVCVPALDWPKATACEVEVLFRRDWRGRRQHARLFELRTATSWRRLAGAGRVETPARCSHLPMAGYAWSQNAGLDLGSRYIGQHEVIVV